MFPDFYHYNIAYKTSNMAMYDVIKPPKYGWVADPFLVEYNHEIYIFAEIFLYKSERNGVIGYSKFSNGSFGEWTITMDRHWHLSFPNVFTSNGKLYLCPESYQNQEVSIYELIMFPNKWKKVKTLISNVEYCDTVFLNHPTGEYMFTYEKGRNSEQGKGLLYKITQNILSKPQVISTNIVGARPAGNIMINQGKYVRVAQIGYPDYGKGLVFYEIDSLWPQYEEHEIKRIYVKDINPNWEGKYIGIHTYNRLNDIEVIDLKEKKFSLTEYIARCRVRQVFTNKYR